MVTFDERGITKCAKCHMRYLIQIQNLTSAVTALDCPYCHIAGLGSKIKKTAAADKMVAELNHAQYERFKARIKELEADNTMMSNKIADLSKGFSYEWLVSLNSAIGLFAEANALRKQLKATEAERDQYKAAVAVGPVNWQERYNEVVKERDKSKILYEEALRLNEANAKEAAKWKMAYGVSDRLLNETRDERDKWQQEFRVLLAAQLNKPILVEKSKYDDLKAERDEYKKQLEFLVVRTYRTVFNSAHGSDRLGHFDVSTTFSQGEIEAFREIVHEWWRRLEVEKQGGGK